jgi:GT2 family glycosyltransferase/glycosyltransferase involved in cell wall biosynthesis
MTKNKKPNKPPTKPVIYVHAKGRSPVSPGSVQTLLELGLPVFSHLGIDGTTKTLSGYDQPQLLLAELAGQFPGRPVILLRAGLQPSGSLLDQVAGIMEKTEQPSVLSLLSNAEIKLNPFAGLEAPSQKGDIDLEGLVNLLAPGNLHTLTEWTDHFAYLSAGAVDLLSSGTNSGGLIQQLTAAGGKLQVPDHLYINDTDSRVFAKLNLQPHESVYPPAFSELSVKLQEWINAGVTTPPVATGGEEPASLHITHSWGGGIAQWIRSFINTDDSHTHYQLRSENTQSDNAFGQKLSLYAGNELRSPVASWWLQPPIESIAGSNADYQKILSEICNRYQVGRVIVSSLIGHSLDALGTGLPTVQVLHDHFPVWPLLGVDPRPYLSESTRADLGKALSEHAKSRNFLDKNELAWSQVREGYLRALTKNDVKIAAPGQWVLDLQNKLEPGFAALESTVIPHGFPALEGLQAIVPRKRVDGRLRMVILGRMQEGKGQKLLSRALPELAKYVQVYLLGTGKPGETFFGVPGVDVILEYERDELGSLLKTIGPDFAALLSVVPETYSFTLSELQQLRIPAIATRIGSFPSRIAHGETGWLIEQDADALVSQVAALHGKSGQIESVRRNLSSITETTPVEMVAAYNRLCPAAKKVRDFVPVNADSLRVQWAAADYQLCMLDAELRSTRGEIKDLGKEVRKIAAWAQAERKNAANWETEARRLTGEFEVQGNRLQETQSKLGQLEHAFDAVSTEHAMMLQSTSWRMTRPLRVARRMAKSFMQARGWNPLRWPWMLASLVRNLHTLGVAGTLQKLQASGADGELEPQADSFTEHLSEAAAIPIDEPATPGPFVVPEHPDASIVIPAHNNWAYTAACLSSLLAVRCNHTFEVIVVDDQSSDETAEKLAEIEGLTCLGNDRNLGFVGSCNRGANHARGEFLVLLNNDTQVTDGWLDELIDTFDQDANIGLVGSRLVYPDGRLQESGGIIFNDASGWNYGRDDTAELPEYQYLREADYCSGACIALKTGYFHELGGLDERYSPAYYEDTDLAFRVRESGLKVVVQPSSVVIHHEGITSGTDTSSGTKKYQLINQQKFFDRWKTELEAQPAPVADPREKPEIRKVIHHRDKGQILFIDAHTPETDQDSSSVRLTNLMRICRELDYGVTFFADNRAYAGNHTRALQKMGIEVLHSPWLESLSEFFRDRGPEFDYIVISRHYVAANYVAMLKRYCPHARFIFDTVDLHYLREERLAELEKSRALKIAAQQTRRSELSVIADADVTLVVSAAEKDVLANDAPDAKVHILSNIHHVPGRDKGFSERKDIYFIGGYQHPPNIDAACWFVNDIWPLIHEQLPEMRFHLVGSNAPQQVSSLQGEGVVFHGHVESLEPFLNDCRLAVAPLRYGAGVKGKANMSMANGQPMVVTSVAAEGLFAAHEKELLIADDAESFAREVIRLYQDEPLWNKLSEASIRNVETHFSMQAARDSILSLFETSEG